MTSQGTRVEIVPMMRDEVIGGCRPASPVSQNSAGGSRLLVYMCALFLFGFLGFVFWLGLGAPSLNAASGDGGHGVVAERLQ